jgi:hypothetical protein
MEKVVVTAPYVMLKVHDPATGGVTVREFYRGGVLPDGADVTDVERLLGKGMLARQEVAFVEPESTVSAVDVLVHTEDDDELVVVPVKPTQADNKAAWVDYAVAMRAEDADEAQARAAAEAMSKADLVKQFG